MTEAVSVLLGTTKGAFILDSNGTREDWAIRGPLFDGWPINHVIGDLFQCWGIPLWTLVLVNQDRSDTFVKVAAGSHEGLRYAVLHL